MSRRPLRTRRPEGSTRGTSGPDDRVGRIDPLTPEKSGRGAAEIREGLTFCLRLPLGAMWNLPQLAEWLRAHRGTRFLLSAPPPRLPCAVGSPATPVATV